MAGAWAYVELCFFVQFHDFVLVTVRGTPPSSQPSCETECDDCLSSEYLMMGLERAFRTGHPSSNGECEPQSKIWKQLGRWKQDSGVETAGSPLPMSRVHTASPLSGVHTVSPMSSVHTTSPMSGVHTTSPLSSVHTVSHMSGVHTTSPMSGLHISAREIFLAEHEHLKGRAGVSGKNTTSQPWHLDLIILLLLSDVFLLLTFFFCSFEAKPWY